MCCEEKNNTYFQRVTQRSDQFEQVVQSLDSRRRCQIDHHFDFVVEFRFEIGADEEDGRAERVAHVGHFLVTSCFQNVIDRGRQIVHAQFVPSDQTMRYN